MRILKWTILVLLLSILRPDLGQIFRYWLSYLPPLPSSTMMNIEHVILVIFKCRKRLGKSAVIRAFATFYILIKVVTFISVHQFRNSHVRSRLPWVRTQHPWWTNALWRWILDIPNSLLQVALEQVTLHPLTVNLGICMEKFFNLCQELRRRKAFMIFH